VTAVAKRQPFVAPAEIRAEVRRIRDERLARTPVPAPPADVADQPGRYQMAIRAAVRRIADGLDLRKAIAPAPSSRPDGPPQEWRDAKAAILARLEPPPAVDPRQKAREQVEEFRSHRQAGEAQ